MASERNRIIELKKYFTSLGINIKIGKTKARGHKGIFMHKFGNFRIDISEIDDENEVLSVLLHEFAHFVHYKYDKKLKSLDFIFDELNDEIMEELIKVTVNNVPKDFAAALYSKKNKLKNDIKLLGEIIKKHYPKFKLSQSCNDIEKQLPIPEKYFIKYDRIKYLNNIYSIENLDTNKKINEFEKAYINLKSKQRKLKTINSRISRLNKYYNSPTELFARFIETYYIKPDIAKKLAPIACSKIQGSKIEFFEKIRKIYQ